MQHSNGNSKQKFKKKPKRKYKGFNNANSRKNRLTTYEQEQELVFDNEQSND